MNTDENNGQQVSNICENKEISKLNNLFGLLEEVYPVIVDSCMKHYVNKIESCREANEKIAKNDNKLVDDYKSLESSISDLYRRYERIRESFNDLNIQNNELTNENQQLIKNIETLKVQFEKDIELHEKNINKLLDEKEDIRMSSEQKVCALEAFEADIERKVI